jgi:hypothetical protein
MHRLFSDTLAVKLQRYAASMPLIQAVDWQWVGFTQTSK